MQVWLADSLKRFYPASKTSKNDSITLEGARGERLSFQVVTKCDVITEAALVSVSANTPKNIALSVRRVGYVPMPHLNTATPPDDVEGRAHIPGYVPDPLLPETSVLAGAGEAHTFWVTVSIPQDIKPANYKIAISVLSNDKKVASLNADVIVHKAVLPKWQNFPVTHWFYADALMDWYKTSFAEKRFWNILDNYFANVTQHGQDTIYVPVFTPPLDGVKRPTQLLGVSKSYGKYRFDWTLVKRWIKQAKANGFENFEWTHLFSQWGIKHALRIYKNHGVDERLLWPADTKATSRIYRDFLKSFLPELKSFLDKERLLENSFFHLSDEPNHSDKHLANYRAARQMLSSLAPWMKIMDALSDISFARHHLTDIPVPSISVAPQFIEEGFPAWAYFCCGPRDNYLNRLLDTPLAKIRMSGWLLYRLRAQGFLHWGYNYWYKQQSRQMIDPFTITDGLAWPGWAYGDTFIVYPGADGPIDSMRWEVFSESLQDYALLQAAGIDHNGQILSDIKDYADFPRNKSWIKNRRHKVLNTLDKQSS